MSFGRLPRFNPEDINEINDLFTVADDEQLVMPEEMVGIALHSGPMDLHRDLQDEIGHPELYGHDPENQATLNAAVRRLILLEELHSGHRELMLKEGRTARDALLAVAAGMEAKIKADEAPYEGWHADDLIPFLDVVVDSYYEHYFPGKEMPSYFS